MPAVRRALASYAERLAKTDGRHSVEQLRDELLERAGAWGRDLQTLRSCAFVLADLRLQGWRLRASEKGICIAYPEHVNGAADVSKEFVRQAHLNQREAQLLQPAVREFIHSMERRRLGPNGWTSIFSLMRQGKEFADKLQGISSLCIEDRPAALSAAIRPYIQVVDPRSTCEFTGLRLMDIWRYFRHTWTTTYYSVPGRSMLLLIRDAAAENHPVIGIAALASALVQLTVRDQWIGWTPQTFISEICNHPSTKWARWIENAIAELLSDIYKADFLREGVLRRFHLDKPSEEVIAKLRIEAAKAKRRHYKFPTAKDHKVRKDFTDKHWQRQTRLDLFRAKRAETLAQLLEARRLLNEAGFKKLSKVALQAALSTRQGRRAAEIIIRHMKSRHVGIGMLDISICGAIAPYNAILGGKLVALMLTSPEIVNAYRDRYTAAPSIIASSLAGRPVVRRPTLVMLGTTSLYGSRLNQYHRISMSADSLGGIAGGVRYELLGESLGFGSSHFSSETVRELEAYLSQSHPGTRVNSIFGEGVSPKLRKVRDGLNMLGFPAEFLLRHGSKRLVYGVALAHNFKDLLLGLSKKPKYILPQQKPSEVTRRIAEFWISRWVRRRIEREDVLEQIAANTLVHPANHGARVHLPELTEAELLFA